MATPTGARADSARGWFARERRRKKQDQSDFIIAGHVATPFNFGNVIVLGVSVFSMILPADVEIALEVNAASAAGSIGVRDVTTGINYLSPQVGISGGRVNVPHLFRAPHEIRIHRITGSPVGDCIVYFRGPKSQLIQIGTATFT